MGLRGPQPRKWDKRIVRLIRRDYSKGMTLDDIRDTYGISKYYIRKIVRPILMQMLADYEKEINES